MSRVLHSSLRMTNVSIGILLWQISMLCRHGSEIHIETGFEREQADLPRIAKTMMSHCLSTKDQDRGFSNFKDGDVAVLSVNSLSRISPL